MIRIFAPDTIPHMDIIELQGKISIPADGAAQEGSSTGDAEIKLGSVLQDHLSASRCTLCIDTLRVEGSRGAYKNSLLVLRRRRGKEEHNDDDADHDTNVIQDKTQNHESSIKGDNRDAPRASSSRVDEGSSITNKTADTGDGDTVLFAKWLQENPRMLDLNYLYADKAGDGNHSRKRAREEASEAEGGDDGNDEMKDYEIVGVAEGYTLFNSKPARVFQ